MPPVFFNYTLNYSFDSGAFALKFKEAALRLERRHAIQAENKTKAVRNPRI